MKDFKDKVAVITGAASGIGYGIAKHCAKEGMKIVLADIEEKPLYHTKKELKAMGARVLSVLTDVSKAKDVKNLAQETFNEYGAVHLLFNNAGVSLRTLLWEQTLADWEWILGVNLWGIIHGIKYFVPFMLEQNTESHIINTASIMGLMTASDIYSIIKHAIVALSEALYGQLASKSKKIKVSVLCPGFVKSKILGSERNRPVELINDPTEVIEHPEMEANKKAMKQMNANGMDPEELAVILFQAIQDEQFYIITDKFRRFRSSIKKRMEKILKAFES